MTEKRPVHIIGGPTASGKSSRALERARKENGVIINADSMQIYNTLSVLTAQPSEEEREQAPHVLYGIREPTKKCSAASWVEMALDEIRKAHANGQVPIIVGGTGFYIKALTEGLSPVPAAPEEVRQAATDRQKELGNPDFHKELARRDPVTAERLHPNETQRLIRAWEVFEYTGKPLSYWRSLPLESPPDHLVFSFEIIRPDRKILYGRCNARFDKMMEENIMEEVENLDNRIQEGTVPADASITHALGFHPLQACLHGKLSLEDAIEDSKTETRQYAKRQVTWFKNQIDESLV